MTDNRFQQDIDAVFNDEGMKDTYKGALVALKERDVDSYDTLFALLRDKNTDAETLRHAFSIVSLLSRKIDKRRAVHPLLNALKSDNTDIRHDAMWALMMLRSKRSVPPLIEIAQNQSESQDVRTMALYALEAIGDQRALPLFTKILLDTGEPAGLRGNAAEWLCTFGDEGSLDDYIAILVDESPEVRFWAAFGLGQLQNHVDVTPALSAIDPITAFDHTLPTYWGWHVDREAFLVLESIYCKKLLPSDEDRAGTWLISPTAEYQTFEKQYRQRTETGYVNLPVPPVNLKIDPAWLAEQLGAQFPAIELDVREPKSQTYLLDWRLTIDEDKFIGGLHRDGYGVVLTGQTEAVKRFAAWYRSIISPEHKLYLYVWADEAQEIKFSEPKL